MRRNDPKNVQKMEVPPKEAQKAEKVREKVGEPSFAEIVAAKMKAAAAIALGLGIFLALFWAFTRPAEASEPQYQLFLPLVQLQQAQADVGIQVHLEKFPIHVGDTVTLTVTTHNFGPQTVGVVNLDYVTNGQFTTPLLSQVGPLANGEGVEFRIAVNVIRGPLNVYIGAEGDLYDPNRTNNLDGISAPVEP